ncbi:MAG: hypothetical protein M0Z60_00825, partial [Nitrospiraceae bacterium]|nr:hypothetical protein [Nitrospiraceae bacterium]
MGGIQFTDLPSLSSGYVDLTTDQSIGGNKSFTGTISSAGAISGPNVTSGTDPGHTHTGAGGGVPSGFMVLGETTTP